MEGCCVVSATGPNSNNNNKINTIRSLPFRNDKSKIRTFTMNAISILMIGTTMASINYDNTKQMKF
jgi:hypothetical protein